MTAYFHKDKKIFAFFAGLFVLSVAVAALADMYLLAAAPFAVLILYAGWQHKNVFFYLLLFTVPFSFEYNFSGALGTDIPDELLMLLVSFVFIASWLYSPALIPRAVFRHPLLIFLIILLCWLPVTVLFSTNPLLSVKYLLAKSWYLGAFVLAPLMLLSSRQAFRNTAAALIVAMLLVMLIILLKHAADEFSFASVNNAVSPFFRNHVNYSSLLVCMLPLLFASLKLTPRGNIRVCIMAAILLMLVALFFAYARGAWLALLAGTIAYWLIKRRMLFAAYIITIAIVLAGLSWLKNDDRYLQYAHRYQSTIFHQNFDEHLVATYQLKDVSTAERFYRWIAGIRMIKDNPLTGYGPSTFYENYKPYAVPAFKTWVSNNPEHSTVHNYFLLTVIEQGLPGLFFLLLLLGGMLYYAQHLYHRIADVFYKTVAGTAGVVLTMILVLNFLSDLVETDKIGSIFFLCLAALIMTDINTRKPSDPSPHIQGIS